MNTFSELDFKSIGDRLKQARQLTGITQESAATSIGMARTTLVAIEKGERRLKELELVNLCKLYNTKPSSILSPGKTNTAIIKYRKIKKNVSYGTDEEQAIELLFTLSQSAAKLEEVSGVKAVALQLPAYKINKLELKIQAEDAAIRVRQILGIGQSPISELISLLEFELGFRIFSRPLNSSISGVYLYQDGLGHCILLNSKHPLTRRAFSAAHELGHAISAPEHIDVSLDKEHAASTEERFSNYFASALLMPTSAIRKYFDSYRSSGVFSANHLVLMAKIFHVSPEALCRWLEDNNLLKKGTYDSIRRRGFAPGKTPSPDDSNCLNLIPKKTSLLALNAYQNGIFSEGQLSSMFALDRVDLRNIFDSLELPSDPPQ